MWNYDTNEVKIYATNIANKGSKKLRGPWSASELYRLSDRDLLAKFNANFCG
jgi:hypothetical protein